MKNLTQRRKDAKTQGLENFFSAALQCYRPTWSRAAKIFPERGLSQAAAATIANREALLKTAFRAPARCELGQLALRFL